MPNSTPPSQIPLETSYRGIAKNKMLLSQTAMKELRTLINFTQLRFHCKKQNPGRTIHFATVKNSSGEAVVQFFSGQTDVSPYACGSFYKMNDDDSHLAEKCQRWRNGKWGKDKPDESRLFDHAFYVPYKHHWLVNYRGRFECDDYYEFKFGDDFWEIFVR